jgi:NAD(P)-dependent dehydrogenase (short-subunit alcohol dehydrogenase family)
MSNSNYQDKTITLVTGANGGIGLATATALARDHGHHVIIGSRNADNGTKVANSLIDQGLSASSVQLDLECESSLVAAVDYVAKTFGRLDVLVNNAAILIDSSDKAGTTYNLFTRTFNTNVIGTALLTDGLIPLLEKSDHPRVVFVSSRMGSATYSKDPTKMWYNLECSAYDSSKAALNVLALNYARRLGPAGAKVNIACPGIVATNLHEGVKGGAPAEVGAVRIVELATLGKDGPTATWSSSDEAEIPW